MKTRLEFQTGSQQSDYKDGALTLHCSDVESAFSLGLLFSDLSAAGKEVVYSIDSGKVFIRIPLTNRAT